MFAGGTSALRARLRLGADGSLSLVAVDAAGLPVLSVESLVSRVLSAGQLSAAGGGLADALFGVEWVPVPGPGPGAPAAHGPVPEAVLAWAGAAAGGAGAVPAEVGRVLGVVQEWLAGKRPAGGRLAVVTRGAVPATAGEGVPDLAGAAVWGLIRSAQSENPGRLVLIDLPPGEDGDEGLATALASGEPEVAIRGGQVYARRLARPAGGLAVPGGAVPWRLETGGTGTLESLALAAYPGSAPLEAGQVRLAVRAAGVGFRDVLIALGAYPGGGVLGGEVAGLVLETGPGVTGLARGDRVAGLTEGGFGPVAVADARLLTRIPDGWSFARAASVPVAFATAWYALAEVAGARAGQRLLVHAAAGGVGMAAVAVGRYLGLEVFATASPGKHAVLAGMGLDAAHVASSRDTGFEAAFAAATGGAGVDIVLNALAGELTDASLRLLPGGGTFIELGQADVRDPAAVARDHPGVGYWAFDSAEVSPVRLGQVLAQVVPLLAAGDLALPPVRCWDVRRAPEALRFMSRARHVGKLVLTIPPDPAAPREAGTALVTGGTGTLGALVAGHLAVTGRARALVLVSRSGPAAPGAAALAASLAARGTAVRVTACDVASRSGLAAVLDRIRPSCPLTMVVHAAGVLDDAVTGSLTPARVEAVMGPKAEAARYLHELTAGADLEAFVLFSSVAAVVGSAGQGSYAAANAYLDALAAARRAAGLPAVSLAWGLWMYRSGIGRNLDQGRIAHIGRSGMTDLSAAEGLALLDMAVARDEAVLIPARLDLAGLRALARQGSAVPPLWRGLAPGAPGNFGTSAGGPAARISLPGQLAVPSGPAGPEGTDPADVLRRQLAGLPGPERDRLLLALVRAHVAAVLGHASPEAVEPGRAFGEIGFDSLTAVELRNRLHAATGLRLPATLIFDYPTPVALAARLRAELLGDRQEAPNVQAAQAATGEPVAIVAMSCRFPGGMASPEQLWSLLMAGGDAISGFPADRGWDLDGLFHPDPDNPGTSYARSGGFVAQAGDFDAGFFGISPREALAMDPQQRLLLEVCWEAVERAGIDPASLRGSLTGMFAGAAASGYGADSPEAEGYQLTGSAASVISGRVSYTLGLEGPAVTVDTACSSSLVALHLACQALRSGECDLALAGGVMIMATPTVFVGFSRQRGLAADGRCKSFSAAADGIGLGEGAGVVVVERLSDARRHGHRVLAVVAGSAVNQDGASSGLTAPNGPSQQRVIRAALASSGLRPDEVDAVEAHGTGTTLGDPIEAQALLATYGQDRPEGRPLWLGSVKSNIGHAQAAAGIAGVIKMVLALQHGLLPRTLHAGEPSPHVDWPSGAVRLLTEAVPWTANGHPRRAGISSFGISGTNAHAILAEAPAEDRVPAGAGAGPPPLLGADPAAWLVSARTAGGLAAQAGRLRDWVAARPELDPGDVGWSLATTRSVFEHRAAVTGGNAEELAAGLAAVAAGQPAAGVVTGSAEAAHGGRVVFAFPGQGGQWAGMGRELAGSCPVFAGKLAECGAALAPYVDWDLAEVLAQDTLPDRADVVQPALWAVMVSLAAAWQAAGVVPDAVVGHSQGEIAAAVVGGILSLEDGARIVARRSQALRALSGRGGMVSVAQDASAVRARIAPWGDRLSVAAVNGPGATVVSGDPQALDELVATCEVRTRRLPVDYASHSIQVEQIRDEVLAALDGISPGPAAIPMVSALTGEWLEGPEAGPGYWYDSLRSPVEFGRAVRVLAGAGHGVFVEVSPHPVLVPAITAPVVTGTLRRDDGGPGRFLASLAQVHVQGVPVDWAAVLPRGRKVPLPTYAFEHQHFWPRPAPEPAGDAGALGLGATGHPLLGAAVELAGSEGYMFTGRLSLRAQPWLADHAVAGTVLLPGTAFVEMAVQAGNAAGCGRVQELALEAPLVLPDDGAVRVQVVVDGPDASGGRAVRVFARAGEAGAEGSWTRHASGRLVPAGVPPVAAEFAVWPPVGAEPMAAGGWYEELAAAGYGYGPAFRGLRAAWRRGEDVFAEVALPPEAAAQATSFGLHPALLDAALHAAVLASGGGDPEGEAEGAADRPGGVRLPFAWTGVSVHAAGASALRVRLRAAGDDGLSLVAVDSTGMPVVSVGSLVSRSVSAGQLGTAVGGLDDALFTVEWAPVPVAEVDGVVLEVGGVVPEVVYAGAAGGADAASAEVGRVLGVVQAWLAGGRPAGERLAVVTRGAVPAAAGEGVTDLAGAAVWGLIRSAQSENPGRLVLVDLPLGGGDEGLAAALGSGEPEVAVREGRVFARRLARPAGGLVPPDDGTPWRLEAAETGTLEGLGLVRCPQAAGPLEPGQVRVAVRAAGLNFRDVLIALGMYPGGGVIGSEVAGIVVEAGPGVAGLAPGDRVAGMVPGGFGPVAVADARVLVPHPRRVVVRVGGGGAGGVHDSLVRADRPGRGPAGAEDRGARGGRRGRDGRGGDRPSPGPGGVRHRLAR